MKYKTEVKLYTSKFQNLISIRNIKQVYLIMDMGNHDHHELQSGAFKYNTPAI